MRATLLVTLLLLAGCVSPSEGLQPAAVADAASDGSIVTREMRLTYVAMVVTGHGMHAHLGKKGETDRVPENATRIVGTATWTSTGATQDEMEVALEGPAGELASYTGKSGFTFELDAQQVKAFSAKMVRAAVRSPGAAVNVELVVVLRVDAPASA